MTNQTKELPYQVVNRFPMTPPQLWWQYTGTPMLNLSICMKLAWTMDVEAFHKAWQTLVDNHPMLRTVFPGGEHAKEQMEIIPPEAFPITVADYSDLDDVSYGLQVKVLQRELNAKVDLERWPLLQVGLVKRSETEHTLLMIYPSYIGDVISGLWILMKEYIKIYDQLLLGEEVPAVPLEQQDRYEEYLHFLNGLDKSIVEQYKTYFETHLPENGYHIPYDFERGRNDFESERCHSAYWTLPVERLRGEKGTKKRVGIYNYLLLALYRTLAPWSGEDQVVICERISGRDLPQSKNLFKSPGFYVVDQLIPLTFTGGETFEEQIRQVEERCENSSMKGAMYNYLNYELTETRYPQHKVSPVRIDYMGRKPMEFYKGAFFDSFRGRFFLERGETDINYGFWNIGTPYKEGILDRDRLFQLDLSPLVLDNTLIFPIYYSVNFHSAKTIAWFAETFFSHLEQIVEEGYAAGYRCIY